MFVSLKFWPRTLVMLFAASAVVTASLPAHAGSGHGPSADQAQTDEAPARQCVRRNTYNDIEDAPC